MKKIIFILITIVSIYLTYYLFSNTAVNYMSISDSLLLEKPNYNDYLKEYLENKKYYVEFNNYFVNHTIFSINEDIINNKTIHINNMDYYFKKSLRESDYVVISIGMEELSQNYNKYNMVDNYNYFNKMYNDIEKLIQEVRKYAQDRIIFLGFYNPTSYYDAKVDEFFYDIDIKLNRLMTNNKITYIDLYELVKGNNYKEKNSVNLNNLGNMRIANILKFYLE